MSKWLTDEKGFYLSPSKQKSVNAQEARRRKKHKTNKYKFSGRKLHRFCPICNTELTTKNVIHESFYNERKGQVYTRALYACKNCQRIWYSNETIKVWKDGRKKTRRHLSNAQFKKSLQGIWL